MFWLARTSWIAGVGLSSQMQKDSTCHKLAPGSAEGCQRGSVATAARADPFGAKETLLCMSAACPSRV